MYFLSVSYYIVIVIMNVLYIHSYNVFHITFVLNCIVTFFFPLHACLLLGVYIYICVLGPQYLNYLYIIILSEWSICGK